MIDGIKKNVHFVVIGKINITKDKLSDILSVAIGKMPDMESPNAKEIEVPKHADKASEYPVIKCSGIAAIVVADYIQKNAAGMGVSIEDGGVKVHNIGWETKHQQLKNAQRIGDYVHQKYEKLGAELPGLLAYFAISNEFAGADVLSKILKGKPKANELRDMIKKSL
jgi:hypothetical protein